MENPIVYSPVDAGKIISEFNEKCCNIRLGESKKIF